MADRGGFHTAGATRGGGGGRGRGGAGGGHRGRGGRGGQGGGDRGGGRGGYGGGNRHHNHTGGGEGGSEETERPKKENILDLKKYMDKRVMVKFNGGREVTGALKGYDALMNLVLDEVEEAVVDEEGNETTRSLGLVVVRGTLLVVISPVDGSEVIANPFLAVEED
ncbi:LSM domain-protein [Podospora australis]|uniref:LSM domain-protein n=1 Tax=Podospora australis TaxID=1536484 RepID=A0AAN7AK36_9PEZI|nr:LSM domain-protein [Podospora australis]